jgi:hypothetical protein
MASIQVQSEEPIISIFRVTLMIGPKVINQGGQDMPQKMHLRGVKYWTINKLRGLSTTIAPRKGVYA